jgi:hypothetical protein
MGPVTDAIIVYDAPPAIPRARVAVLEGAPRTLGAYAESIETSPQATLATTGALVGALWGGLVGYLGARACMSERPALWAGAGAAAGAVGFGLAGNQQGAALKQWLAQY